MPRRLQAWLRCNSQRRDAARGETSIHGEVGSCDAAQQKPADPPPPYDSHGPLQIGISRSEEIRLLRNVDVVMSRVHADLAGLVDASADVLAIAAPVREGCIDAAVAVLRAAVAGTVDEINDEIFKGSTRVSDAVIAATAAAPAKKALAVAIATAQAISEVAYKTASAKTRPIPHTTAATVAAVAHGKASDIGARVIAGNSPVCSSLPPPGGGHLRSGLPSYLP